MATTPLSLSQASFLLSSLISAPPHRLDGRPLLSFRPFTLSPPREVGSATLSLGGSTTITATVSLQIVKNTASEEENQDDPGALSSSTATGTGLLEEDEIPGTWSVEINTSPSCLPPLINAATSRSSKTGNMELDSTLELTSRNLRRHLNRVLPLEQFIILDSPFANAASKETMSNRERLRGATYWACSLDITVQSMAGGNILDAIWSTAYAAVYRSRIPRTREVSYIPPTSDNATIGEGDRADEFGIKSLKGEKKSKRGTTTAGGKDGAGVAVDFELLDTSDEDGLRVKGREQLGVGITIALLPSNQHLLDPTLDEELCLPAGRRLFLVVSPPAASSSSPIIHATHLLPSPLNLTAGESTTYASDEDRLRFPMPPTEATIEGGSPATPAWSLPDFKRLKEAAKVASGFGVEWATVLQQWSKSEEGEETKDEEVMDESK